MLKSVTIDILAAEIEDLKSSLRSIETDARYALNQVTKHARRDGPERAGDALERIIGECEKHLKE